MGNSSSSNNNKSNKVKSKEAEQISYLGNRYPFGDDELKRFINVYDYLSKHSSEHKKSDEDPEHHRLSFLTDWSITCSTIDLLISTTTTRANNNNNDNNNTNSTTIYHKIEEIKNDRYKTIQIIEKYILPQHFGQTLEGVAFVDENYNEEYDSITNSIKLLDEDEDEEPASSSPNNTVYPTEEDTMMVGLEKFVDGAAKCVRRGERATLTILFKCCSYNKKNTPPAAAPSSFSSSSPFETHNNNNNNADEDYEVANAIDLIDLGYRIGLASVFISDSITNQAASEHHSEEEEYEYRDPTDHGEVEVPLEGITEEEEEEEENDNNANSSNNNNEEEEEEQQNDDDDDGVDEYIKIRYLPPKDTHKDKAIQALSNSLLEYTKRKQQRYGGGGSAAASGGGGFSRSGRHFGTTTSGNTSTTATGNDNDDSNDDDNNVVTLLDFIEWSELTCPLLASSLSTFMHYVFFPDMVYPPSRTKFTFPFIHDNASSATLGCSAFFDRPTSSLLYSFACMSSSLCGGLWHRLYTSTEDGLSFNRLQLSLLGYGGPTLIIIREASREGGIFGAFTSTQWKETSTFYGNSDCFLFTLIPETNVYRPTGNDTKFMYCNSEARSKGYDKLPHGIGFGGTTEKPRLFISESFDDCMASSNDVTFARGPLLPRKLNVGGSTSANKYFDIDTIEVWGVGSVEEIQLALEARKLQRGIKAATIKKARKVDKAAFLDDFKSGIIESKAFAHRDQIRGRHDACIDEDEHGKNAYTYEK